MTLLSAVPSLACTRHLCYAEAEASTEDSSQRQVLSQSPAWSGVLKATTQGDIKKESQKRDELEAELSLDGSPFLLALRGCGVSLGPQVTSSVLGPAAARGDFPGAPTGLHQILLLPDSRMYLPRSAFLSCRWRPSKAECESASQPGSSQGWGCGSEPWRLGGLSQGWPQLSSVCASPRPDLTAGLKPWLHACLV